MFEVITWTLTVLSIVGVILNAQRKVCGFYVWMVTNAAWAAVALYKGVPAQAALFIVYFILCFYGVWKWKRGY